MTISVHMVPGPIRVSAQAAGDPWGHCGMEHMLSKSGSVHGLLGVPRLTHLYTRARSFVHICMACSVNTCIVHYCGGELVDDIH